jgi:FixJ family two-component response regulator
MTETGPLIAVLDDEPQMCKALSRLLKTHGYGVDTYGEPGMLIAACGSHLPDCLLLDLNMPHMNGFEVLEHLAAQQMHLPVIVFTGRDKPGYAERARALGARNYLLKPLAESQLLAAISAAIQRRESTDAGFLNCDEPD